MSHAYIVVTIVGDPGTGKSTAIEVMLKALEDRFDIAFLNRREFHKGENFDAQLTLKELA